MPAPIDQAVQRVYARQSWDEDWSLQAQLFCDALVETVSPDISSAAFSYRTGEVLGYGETSFTDRPALTLNDWFVKVEAWPADEVGLSIPDNPNPDAPPPYVWYGVFVEDERDLEGDHGADKPAGPQSLRAYGLEFLLERKKVTTSAVADGEGGTMMLGRAIGFNLGGGQANDREFIANGGGEGDVGPEIVIFPATLSSATAWNGVQILRYLLQYHQPADIAGVKHLDIHLTGEFAHLEAQSPALHVHGKSLKAICDELMPRHRLCGWRMKVTDDVDVGEILSIDSFTFTAEDIELADGTTIPATTRTKTLTTNDDPLVKACGLRRSVIQAFQSVLVTSERRGSVFSLSTQTTTELAKDWTSTEETTYETGASDSAAYATAQAAKDYNEMNALNRAFRATPAVERVWRWFKVPDSWDGTANFTPVFPKLNEDGSLDAAASENYWLPGLRYSDVLPLIAGVDYTSVTEPDDVSVAAGVSGYLRPFVVIKEEDNATWRLGDQLPPLLEDPAKGTARNWSLALTMRDDRLGAIITVRGDDQHAIASTEFSPADSNDQAWRPRRLYWKQLYVTAYCQHDHYCQASWPDPPPADTRDVFLTLHVEVPGYRLDYLAPSTILGVDDAGALISATGGIIRDDRDKLKAIARLAFEWYGRTRQVLSYTQRKIDPQFSPGDLITELNPDDEATKETVNTVVTQLSIDFRAGTHTIQTDFAQLDVRG